MGSDGPKESCVRWGSTGAKGRCHGNHFSIFMGVHWRHLANTTEPSVCGGDEALCQINYFDTLLGSLSRTIPRQCLCPAVASASDLLLSPKRTQQPPTFRPMSTVAKRSHTSPTAEHLLQVLSSTAVGEMGDRLATIDIGRKEEGCCAPFGGGAAGSGPIYLYKSSAVAEMGDRGHNRHGPKRVGGAVPRSQGELSPHVTQSRLGRGLTPNQVAS